jgi:hypothetical protein
MFALLSRHFDDDGRDSLGRRFVAAKSRLSMRLRAA